MSEYKIIKIEKCANCIKGFARDKLTVEQIEIIESGKTNILIKVDNTKCLPDFTCHFCKGTGEIRTEVDINWGANPVELNWDVNWNPVWALKNQAKTYPTPEVIDKWFAGLEKNERGEPFCGCGDYTFMHTGCDVCENWKQKHFACQFALIGEDLLEIAL